MQRSTIFASILISAILLITGCSTGQGTPVNSSERMDISNSTLPSLDSHSETILYGMWTMNLDLESKTVEVVPFRDLSAHMNVTGLIPTPVIVINSINLIDQTVDVDVTINNPFAITGYDVRMIIFTDSAGHRLLNFDSWTNLYDIPGGLPINPFMAFAKSETNRMFAGPIGHTENLIISIPGFNPSVRFAIEASFPSNCTEPYEMNSFMQGEIYDILGSSTDIDISVFDWQSDVNAVNLYCPQIHGPGFLALSSSGSEIWEGTLVNNAEADLGDYPAYFIAYSSGSGTQALYTEVMITVSHEHQPNDPQQVGYCSTGSAMGVDVWGDYALIAGGYSGLKIVNILFPDAPTLVGEIDIDGLAGDVANYYNHAFLVDMTGGYLVSVDWTLPEAPFIADTIYTSGMASGITIDWPYAFVANGYSSTKIYDISDPHDLVYVSGVPENDFSNHAIADGIWLAVADYEAGVQIVNLDDIENPVVVKTIDTYQAYGVEIKRPFVYVADYYEGVKFIDISDPYVAYLAHAVDTSGKAVKLDAQGFFLYVADSRGGLVIIDIIDPYSAEIFTVVNYANSVNDVFVRDNYAYVAESYGLSVVQLW